MTTTHQKFVWDSNEQNTQDDAVTSIKQTAEEHAIEVFTSGGVEFAERIENAGLKPKNFTLHDFEEWKGKVVDAVIKAQVEAEREAFAQLVIKKNNAHMKKKID
jgi:hypothetical protein